MRQDRRTNGWVVIGSIVELILGLILVGAGAFASIGGFAYIAKLDKLKDLQYFINQKWIKYAIDKLKLTPKFVYLYLGIIVAVIGIATIVFAIVSLNYVKKHKVVRRRAALCIYSVLSLAIVGCAVAYFVIERNNLPDNIKYVLYGVMGGFGFVALCKLLGIIFGRSEQFMSSDNNKYAVNNRSMPSYQPQPARPVQVQNVQPARPIQQVRPNQPQMNMPNGHPRPVQNMSNGVQYQQRPIPRPQGDYPVRPAQPLANQSRPSQTMPNQVHPTRPVQSQGTPNQMQTARPNQQNMQNVQRPMQRPMNNGQPMQRPVNSGTTQPRPMQNAQPVRPVQNSTTGSKSGAYCRKCGRLLTPEERFCSRCGSRVGE